MAREDSHSRRMTITPLLFGGLAGLLRPDWNREFGRVAPAHPLLLDKHAVGAKSGYRMGSRLSSTQVAKAQLFRRNDCPRRGANEARQRSAGA